MSKCDKCGYDTTIDGAHFCGDLPDGFGNSYGNYGSKPMFTEAQLAAAVADMQERCAKVAEAFGMANGLKIAAAIRSLKP